MRPEEPARKSAPPESRTESPADAKKKNQVAEETRELAHTPESTDLRKDEPAQRANQPAAPAAQMFAQESVAPSTVLQRTFQIGGTTFIVDAPDSVRIVEDAAGRMILIYTSDGLIRIRLAD